MPARGEPRGRSPSVAETPSLVPRILLWCLLLSSALPGPLTAQGNPANGIIKGQATDELTGVGLSEAAVELLDDFRRVLHTTNADDAGYFLFPHVRPGPFRLRITRFGYLTTTTPIWWVQPGDILDVVVWLRPDAIPMAPLEIVGRTRTRLPVLSGFYRRMEESVGGTFLGPEAIEERHALRITDLLGDLPGVHIETASSIAGTGRVVTMGRSLPGSRGGPCPVQVYVDGILATRQGDAVPLDDLASPADLEGVEIYRGMSTVPPEFLTPDARCGVIILWTKRGGGATRSSAPLPSDDSDTFALHGSQVSSPHRFQR